MGHGGGHLLEPGQAGVVQASAVPDSVKERIVLLLDHLDESVDGLPDHHGVPVEGDLGLLVQGAARQAGSVELRPPNYPQAAIYCCTAASYLINQLSICPSVRPSVQQKVFSP